MEMLEEETQLVFQRRPLSLNQRLSTLKTFLKRALIQHQREGVSKVLHFYDVSKCQEVNLTTSYPMYFSRNT